MLSQFAINHILAAFDLAESESSITGQLTPRTKAKIEYCRRLIAHAKEQERAKHMGAYAEAIGTKPSQGLMDSIAADCARYGSN